MFNYESTENYDYVGNALWFSGFFNYIVFSAVSATIDDSRPQEDKPCYLAVPPFVVPIFAGIKKAASHVAAV